MAGCRVSDDSGRSALPIELHAQALLDFLRHQIGVVGDHLANAGEEPHRNLVGRFSVEKAPHNQAVLLLFGKILWDRNTGSCEDDVEIGITGLWFTRP